MRVALYARVSTRKQDESLRSQLARLRKMAASRWPGASVEQFSETQSSVRDPRPAFKSMMDLVDARRVDVVLLTRLDRAARSLVDGVFFAERVERASVALVLLDQPYDTTTAIGRAMGQVSFVFAQLERELILERSKAGMAEARRRGVRFGRPPRELRMDLDEVRERVTTRGIGAVAQELGVSRHVLRRRLNAGPRAAPRRSRHERNGQAHRSPDPRGSCTA